MLNFIQGLSSCRLNVYSSLASGNTGGISYYKYECKGSFDEVEQFCTKNNQRMTAPLTGDMDDVARNVAEDFFIPWKYNVNEGKWKSLYGTNNIGIYQWQGGEPKGLATESCVVMFLVSNFPKLKLAPCDDAKMIVCEDDAGQAIITTTTPQGNFVFFGFFLFFFAVILFSKRIFFDFICFLSTSKSTMALYLIHFKLILWLK